MPPVESQVNLHIRAVWPGFILLADQLQILHLISTKLMMDSFKNGSWIIPFKKLGRLWVNNYRCTKQRNITDRTKNISWAQLCPLHHPDIIPIDMNIKCKRSSRKLTHVSHWRAPREVSWCCLLMPSDHLNQVRYPIGRKLSQVPIIINSPFN